MNLVCFISMTPGGMKCPLKASQKRFQSTTVHELSMLHLYDLISTWTKTLHLIITNNNNHIKYIICSSLLSSTSLSRTIVLSDCYVCCCSIKFSLSGRDGESNRFLSSWRVIPSTHPSIPYRRASGSPLVRLRNRGSDQCCTPRATTLPGRSGLLTQLPLVLRQWSPAHRTSSGSAHFILAGLPA